MGGNISNRDLKILLANSGRHCPRCKEELVVNGTPHDRESLIGEIAHIKGDKPSAPRYDSKMSERERNSHKNLIFVCRRCHKIIDDQPNTYTVERLQEIKAKHESWINERTRKEVMNVTFIELRVIMYHLISGQPTLSESYALIPPRDKIKKNELSAKSERLIMMGMTQVKQVSDFINRFPDIEFGNRLKQGFVTEYGKQKNIEHLSGDDLFNSLLDFASGGSNDFKQKAAGLAVLVYLFEKCEVFEK
ncbi:MAG: hypothetical protein OEW87_12285 [Flavobacteriaceae bacterium]|nr:hypothetical protein [Flavobacteriaceae bacterium]